MAGFTNSDTSVANFSECVFQNTLFFINTLYSDKLSRKLMEKKGKKPQEEKGSVFQETFIRCLENRPIELLD